MTAYDEKNSDQEQTEDQAMNEYGLVLKRRLNWIWWLLGFDRL